jgi:RimJ/RimL family protein N-acetyltransferase
MRQQPTDGVVMLAPFGPSDASVLRDGDRDPEHRRWFDFPDTFVPSLEHSLGVIARWEQERTSGTRFTFAVRDAATGTLLGGCELQPGGGGARLSYWTYAPHRGRGVASRAVALACKVAIEQLGFCQIEILTDPDNTASRRVAVRNGFRECGVCEGRVRHINE